MARRCSWLRSQGGAHVLSSAPLTASLAPTLATALTAATATAAAVAATAAAVAAAASPFAPFAPSVAATSRFAPSALPTPFAAAQSAAGFRCE